MQIAGAKQACPACGSADIVVCADRGRVPVFQNARYPDPATARDVARGHLILAVCRRCGFGFNATFDPHLAQYDAAYENDQTISPHFLRHVDAMAGQALAMVADRPDALVVEVGCGQGGFLRHLLAAPGGALGGAVGFDPSLRHPVDAGGLRLEARLFDAAAARSLATAPDLVILRHVIEHVDTPFELMAAIRATMDLAKPARILIETPCLEWILQHDAWHDVFYEHCSYFTAASLARLLRRAGFTKVAVTHVFGGQYLAASGEAGPAAEAADPGEGAAVAERAAIFGHSFEAFVARWRERLAERQPLGIWGAGAKGVTFAALIGAAVPVRGLIDIDPKKQGSYAAMSALPILSPAEAAGQGIRHVVVMNPNYASEIAAMVADLPSPMELTIMDAAP
ncbi:MAG: class I SAM-dependent methyltransferase [Nevskia sp.]|nr:class I SAM-dependent methyltransferase [Nevskia sp.]